MFFVISGYLITSLLLSEFRKEGRVDLVAFWLRRARRLLPAVGVLIAVVMVAGAFFDLGQISTLRGQALASMAYVTNWDLISATSPTSRSSRARRSSGTSGRLRSRSSSICSGRIAFAFCMTRFGHRRLVIGVIAGAVASSLLMAILFDPVNPNRVFYGTDTRATPLLIGVALAFFWHPERLKRETGSLAPVLLNVMGAIGLSMVVITFLTVHDYDISLYHGGFLLLSIWTAMLIAALAHPAASIGQTLGNPAMRWLGLRSYSFYLWHWPVLELTRPGIDVPLHGPVLFALQLGRHSRSPTSPTATWSSRSGARPAGSGRTGRASAGSALRSPSPRWWSSSAGADRPQGPSGTAARRVGRDHAGKAKYVVHPISVTRAVSEASGGRAPVKASARRGRRAKALPVLALGDSVMVDASQSLGRLLGPRLTLNAHVGRQASEVIDLLHRYAAHGGLPDYVVLQLGDNGPVYSDDLERLHDALKGVPHVLLVNVEVPRSWQGEVNSLLSQAADDWG